MPFMTGIIQFINKQIDFGIKWPILRQLIGNVVDSTPARNNAKTTE